MADQRYATGKVALVLDDCRVVLTLGTRNGVRSGDLVVIRPLSVRIEDPDSKEHLGQVITSLASGYVEDEVQESVCVAATDMPTSRNWVGEQAVVALSGDGGG
jgi:hypothetical protein